MEEGEHGNKWHEEAFVLKVSLLEQSSWVLLSPCCPPGGPFLVKSLALEKKKMSLWQLGRGWSGEGKEI